MQGEKKKVGGKIQDLDGLPCNDTLCPQPSSIFREDKHKQHKATPELDAFEKETETCVFSAFL